MNTNEETSGHPPLPPLPPYKKRAYPQRKPLTKEQRHAAQDAFLQSYREHGTIRYAASQAGIDRSLIDYWCEHDEQFGFRYNRAKSDVKDAIRLEIYKRAKVGETRYVTSMGKIVTKKDEDGNDILLTFQEKSDILLMFHAKALMPEYRDKQPTEQSGRVDIEQVKDLLLQRLTERGIDL